MPSPPASAPRISDFYPGGKPRDTRVISAHDLRTGTVRWERFGRIGSGIEWSTCGGGWCYYTVPAGLEAVELQAGGGWFVSARSTSASAAAGLGFAVGLWLTFLGGSDFAAEVAEDLGFVYPPYPPEVTHHLGSPPLTAGGRVTFAAHKEILSCSAATGAVLWRRRLDDLEGVASIRSLGGEILTVGHGWRYKGSRIEPCRFASLSIIDSSTGGTLRSLRWASREKGSTRTVLDALPYSGGFLLLQPGAIRFYSNRLDLLTEIPSREEHGGFLTWMPASDGVIIRTSNGVLSISGSPPRVAWWRAMPPVLLHDGTRHRLIDEFAQRKNSLVPVDNAWIDPAHSWPEMARIATGRAQHAQDFLVGTMLCTRTGSGFAFLDAQAGRVLLEQSDLKASVVGLHPSGWCISRTRSQITTVRIAEVAR